MNNPLLQSACEIGKITGEMHRIRMHALAKERSDMLDAALYSYLARNTIQEPDENSDKVCISKSVKFSELSSDYQNEVRVSLGNRDPEAALILVDDAGYPKIVIPSMGHLTFPPPSVLAESPLSRLKNHTLKEYGV